MAEEALLQAVLDLAAYRHVRAVHFPPSYTARGRVITAYRGDGKGWPDVHLTGPGGVLYRELKSADGRLTADQAQYLADLQAAGQDADVWRPADLKPGGRIPQEIDAIARPRTPSTTT
jgi:hypothetical protein